MIQDLGRRARRNRSILESSRMFSKEPFQKDDNERLTLPGVREQLRKSFTHKLCNVVYHTRKPVEREISRAHRLMNILSLMEFKVEVSCRPGGPKFCVL